MNPNDNYYYKHEEPIRSCFLAMRDLILSQHPALNEQWKYSMPFFCYSKKMFCYLWIRKESGTPYLGVVEGKRIRHPSLIAEKRSRMKILLLDPKKDLPIKIIRQILKEALTFYK